MIGLGKSGNGGLCRWRRVLGGWKSSGDGRWKRLKIKIAKNLADFRQGYIFALLLRKYPKEATEIDAALVNRLRRLPFTEE